MNPWFKFLLWIFVGGFAGLMHLYRLKSLVMQSAALSDEKAQKNLTRFAPLRILMFVPILLAAAYSGLPACVGFILGMVSGRVVGAYLFQSTTSLDQIKREYGFGQRLPTASAWLFA